MITYLIEHVTIRLLCLYSLPRYSSGEFLALQLIFLEVLGAVYFSLFFLFYLHIFTYIAIYFYILIPYFHLPNFFIPNIALFLPNTLRSHFSIDIALAFLISRFCSSLINCDLLMQDSWVLMTCRVQNCYLIISLNSRVEQFLTWFQLWAFKQFVKWSLRPNFDSAVWVLVFQVVLVLVVLAALVVVVVVALVVVVVVVQVIVVVVVAAAAIYLQFVF